MIEVTGWNAENESVWATTWVRDDETPEECLARLIREEGIVEISDTRGAGE